MALEEQWAEILTQAVIVEREVSFPNFEKMMFESRSIGDIMDGQDLVQEFYVTLLDVVDIDTCIWDITVCRVSFQLSANLLAAYMGMQRPVGAFPAVEILIKSTREEIFSTLQGRDMVVVGSFIRHNEMLPFWRIMHLIFAHDIEPIAHTTQCPIVRGELMLIVARGLVVDLPLYIFMTLRSETKTPSSSGLSYILLLTQFLYMRIERTL
ncbi:hypothetical protein CJ030_MR0G007572 [Morella rubra]|uniref:Uncharacterized protein n=1 Tax=Morella rubra TaxID=262757 RepID=A0A6A1UJC6_9ROSI|nr:hypothetical protein CJ030_MR0G007572 [Morella rubra]